MARFYKKDRALGDAQTGVRLLHATDQVPVVQRMVDPANGSEVSNEEVRRGLEVSTFVVVSPGELAETQPETMSRAELLRPCAGRQQAIAGARASILQQPREKSHRDASGPPRAGPGADVTDAVCRFCLALSTTGIVVGEGNH